MRQVNIYGQDLVNKSYSTCLMNRDISEYCHGTAVVLRTATSSTQCILRPQTHTDIDPNDIVVHSCVYDMLFLGYLAGHIPSSSNPGQGTSVSPIEMSTDHDKEHPSTTDKCRTDFSSYDRSSVYMDFVSEEDIVDIVSLPSDISVCVSFVCSIPRIHWTERVRDITDIGPSTTWPKSISEENIINFLPVYLLGYLIMDGGLIAVEILDIVMVRYHSHFIQIIPYSHCIQ